MMEFFSSPEFLVLAILFLARTVFGAWNTTKLQSPKAFVLDRWLRLVFFALAIACVMKFAFSFSNIWICFAIGCLIFFGVDTLLLWLQISASSLDDSPIFGKYRECDTAWRPELKFLDLKREIENRGFRKRGSYKMNIEEVSGAEVLLTVFDSFDRKNRLAISFVPFGASWITVTDVTSCFEDGEVCRTTSSIIPFGLEYPENYDVRRYPLISNPLKVVDIHLRRVAKSGKNTIIFDNNPYDFISDEIANSESQSRKEGLLNSPSQVDSFGKFSHEGKCRIWAEMIELSYFPFFAK